MSITLFQFPISHFCEKARWALDYKGLDYQVKNLLPGLHGRTARQLARKTTVPILQHDGIIVQGSSQIITYLDETFPERKLTPVDPEQARAALEWEQYLDDEVGVHLGRYMYHHLLDQPAIVIGFFTQGGPWWSKGFYRLAFPQVVKLMRKHMRIDAAGAAEARLHVDAALDRISVALQESPFLVGGEFSRADLTAAALLAPVFAPVQYGLQWPDDMPEPLNSLLAPWRERLGWAETLYERFR